MHTLSTEFNRGKLLSMFILTLFPLLQDSFHEYFRFLFSLFMSSRTPYSCPSIERNFSRDLSGFHNGFIHNLTTARDFPSQGLIATEAARSGSTV
jgi:hypothetical protein